MDPIFEEKLRAVVGPAAAEEARKVVEGMRLERALFGQDRSGLTDKVKIDLCNAVKDLVEDRTVKANEALIGEQDNRGGFLVSSDVAAAIQRIAASVGLVMNQAMKWPMRTDELDIPSYRGSFLLGEYLGVDAAGSDTGLTFNSANLIAKIWQLSFVVSKALFADASVNLADWLLAMAGESLANMVDKQGFAGTGTPFVGILNVSGTSVTTIGSAAFTGYKVIDDSSTLIGSLDESVLEGAAFYMNRTVWANLRAQKGTNEYILPYAGAASNNVLAQFPAGGIRPKGEILGYPVFTTQHLPGTTAVSTKFVIFGNLKALAYGEKGTMEVEVHRSGSFGGKEVAKAYQRGIVYNHRHAVVASLPAAFAIAQTAAA